MKSTATYEWTSELHDEIGDIQDNDFSDKRATLRDFSDEGRCEVALLRRYGNEDEGELSRAYAYVTDDRLPDTFDEGQKIPERYRNELKRFTKS
tara:strand:- start:1624 stop:1905 length:282 start_codon:yes stop_codon:yes gene_type:complete